MNPNTSQTEILLEDYLYSSGTEIHDNSDLHVMSWPLASEYSTPVTSEFKIK